MRVESSKVGIKRLQSVIFCLVCPGYLHITRGLITAEQTAEMPHGAGDKDELKKKKKKKIRWLPASQAQTRTGAEEYRDRDLRRRVGRGTRSARMRAVPT